MTQPETKQQVSSNQFSLLVYQEGRHEKEGKRRGRRKDNSRFAANPHIVKPTVNDFGVYSSPPRETFPVPLPPFLSRRTPAPSALSPIRDPISSNAGRFSLSLKGIRRELRRSGCEQTVLDIEEQLTQWLHSGGIILLPDYPLPPTAASGKQLGRSNTIIEVSRSPTELVWRIDEAFPRFILHCVARFHGVVSFSKTAPENDVRLTHLLRPNVTRPDFTAVGTQVTPPASDVDTHSVIVDTEDSDTGSELENVLGSEVGDITQPPSLDVLFEDIRQVDAPHRREDVLANGGLSWSMESLTLASSEGDREKIFRERNIRDGSSWQARPSRRIQYHVPQAGDNQMAFWNYVFA